MMEKVRGFVIKKWWGVERERKEPEYDLRGHFVRARA